MVSLIESSFDILPEHDAFHVTFEAFYDDLLYSMTEPKLSTWHIPSTIWNGWHFEAIEYIRPISPKERSHLTPSQYSITAPRRGDPRRTRTVQLYRLQWGAHLLLILRWRCRKVFVPFGADKIL